ncbi:MAG: ATP-binding cassette domain-containing protein [Oscillospiraceae bacterium]|nr:ATP-binding cassette domain-containing protein [Oscillospiraceae bacterium]
MEILTVKNLNFTYPLCQEKALDEISFSVHRGELLVLCGATGSGKSTLLQMLKPELTPTGRKSGEIFLKQKNLDSLTETESASAIGYVMQKPEQQIVTDKVWHELAFGLENLHLSQNVIARRVAEMASYFGIGAWYDRNTAELSGGQKQLLNLASVMTMQPELLILDEPTAQLDPIAASEFLSVIKKLNQDLGLTVILTEHRLEEAIPLCDRLMIMQNGRILTIAPPRQAILSVRNHPDLLYAMPAASRLFLALECEDICPLTVREGRELMQKYHKNHAGTLPEILYQHSGVPALEFQEVYFRYERHSPDILQGVNLTVYEQEIFCILGENGSGKSTCLKTAANLLKIYSGNIKVFGKKLKAYRGNELYQNCLAMLPQDVQTVFLKNTVREEFQDAGTELAFLPFDAEKLLERHPYDLSGGEQQLAALAKVLAAHPKILLLDEPTKGIDAAAKQKIIQVLRKLRQKGMTIIAVTHDVEFAAECADRCAMFFHGRIIAEDTPKRFFSENSFYTTAVSRMTRDYFRNIVTVQDAVNLLKQN